MLVMLQNFPKKNLVIFGEGIESVCLNLPTISTVEWFYSAWLLV